MRNIEYKVPYENMITRLPALFAYISFDEFGNSSVHKATDSPNGCYGKIVQNIKLPEGAGLTIDGVDILNTNKAYTFRTIISYYYRYVNELADNDGFRTFVEEGIGKVPVDSELLGKYPSIPKYIYLSNAGRIYDDMVKMGKQCEFYNKNKKDCGDDKYLCCLCKRYELMGGDEFRDYVSSLIGIADEIAEKYLSYCSDDGMNLEFDVDLTSNCSDFGVMDCYVAMWIPYKKYYPGDKVFYDGYVWLCNAETTGKWIEETEKVVFDEESFDKVTDNGIDTDDTAEAKLNGKTDSKLTDLRRFVTYENEVNAVEMPSQGEDWLFYYRKDYITNIQTLNDERGNIISLSKAKEGISVAAIDKFDLLAYGDVITDIVCNKDEKTITFTYKQGVHLVASGNASQTTDDDGNVYYNWPDFTYYKVENDSTEVDSVQLDEEIEKNQKSGINYTETYTFDEGGDLDRLINGQIMYEGAVITFEDYVNGMYDKSLRNYKFAFVTENTSFTYDKVIANQNAQITSIVTEFSTDIDNHDNFMKSETFHRDSLNGISYAPTVKSDVKIERGSTSVFHKHLAFGEIKTMEDLENYQNGSFFRLSNG